MSELVHAVDKHAVSIARARDRDNDTNGGPSQSRIALLQSRRRRIACQTTTADPTSNMRCGPAPV